MLERDDLQTYIKIIHHMLSTTEGWMEKGFKCYCIKKQIEHCYIHPLKLS